MPRVALSWRATRRGRRPRGGAGDRARSSTPARPISAEGAIFSSRGHGRVGSRWRFAFSVIGTGAGTGVRRCGGRWPRAIASWHGCDDARLRVGRILRRDALRVGRMALTRGRTLFPRATALTRPSKMVAARRWNSHWVCEEPVAGLVAADAARRGTTSRQGPGEHRGLTWLWQAMRCASCSPAVGPRQDRMLRLGCEEMTLR